MDKKTATSEDIERLVGEFGGIEQNQNIQALSDKIAETEKTYILNEKIKQLLSIAYNNRGIAYSKRGEHEKALEDYNEAIGLKPDYANAYTNRGNVYKETGKYEEAIEDYSKAIDLNPHSAVAYTNRGIVYSKRGEHEKALEDCSKAIDLDSDFVEAHYNRGVVYGERGERKKAIDDYSKAIELKPNYADAHYNRGATYKELDEHEKAIKDYNEAIKLSITEAPSREDIDLYHYQPINKQSLQAFSRQELWLSSPKSFNDPLDGDYLYTTLTTGKWKNPDLEKALDGVVIASFHGELENQKNKKNNAKPNCCHTLMWSHYGAAHRGICLQFAYQEPPDTQKFPSMLEKVDYQPERRLDFSSINNLLLKGFAVKDEQWGYESEYRIICHEATELCYAVGGTLRTYKELGLELKAIIFGLKCDRADRDLVRKLSPKDIRFYQMEQEAEDSFLLCAEPVRPSKQESSIVP